MLTVALKIVAAIGLWGSVVMLSLAEMHSVLLNIGMLAASLGAIALFVLSDALEAESLREILTHARTWSLTVRMAVTKALMWWLTIVPAATTGIALARSSTISGQELGFVVIGVTLALGIAGFLTAKAVEKWVARSLLHRFVEELNTTAAHEAIFRRYAPYLYLRTGPEHRSEYRILFRPPEFVTTLPFDAYVLEIVWNPLSMRWELSKPW